MIMKKLDNKEFKEIEKEREVVDKKVEGYLKELKY